MGLGIGRVRMNHGTESKRTESRGGLGRRKKPPSFLSYSLVGGFFVSCFAGIGPMHTWEVRLFLHDAHEFLRREKNEVMGVVFPFFLFKKAFCLISFLSRLGRVE